MGFLGEAAAASPAAWDLSGRVAQNAPVSSGLWRFDLELPCPVPFAPGQFAMLNLRGPQRLVFRRPFSILAAADRRLSFLYRVVGGGTARLAELRGGEVVDCLAPLGVPFPAPDAAMPPAVILAGGVGLPPLHAWYARYRRAGDLAYFGGRNGEDVPWSLLDADWRVSVDDARDLPAGRSAFHGRVTDLAGQSLAATPAAPRLVLACGPTPLLRAAAAWADARGWRCLVSLEEHMGCGYGVCKGCVVPVRDEAPAGWRFATSCTEGPVFDAAAVAWDRFAAPHEERA